MIVSLLAVALTLTSTVGAISSTVPRTVRDNSGGWFSAVVTHLARTSSNQRRNLGQARIRGLQANSEYRLSTFWRVPGGYLNNHATVEETRNPAIVGNKPTTIRSPRLVNGGMRLRFGPGSRVELARNLLPQPVRPGRGGRVPQV